MVTFQPKDLETRVEMFYQVLTEQFWCYQEGAAQESEERAGRKSHSDTTFSCLALSDTIPQSLGNSCHLPDTSCLPLDGDFGLRF